MSATTSTAAEVLKPSLETEERDRLLRTLDLLLEGDEEEQRETFAFLKNALDENHSSNRKLFS